MHPSAFPTLRQVATGDSRIAAMVAISCREDVVTKSIRITVYGEAFQGDGKEPLQVDSFVSVRQTLEPRYFVRFIIHSSLTSL